MALLEGDAIAESFSLSQKKLRMFHCRLIAFHCVGNSMSFGDFMEKC